MAEQLTFGPLRLSFTLLKSPSPGRQPATLSAAVVTPYSSAAVENLLCDFGDLLAFRARLRKFIEQEDEGIAAMHVLMPMFDMAIIATLHGTARAEIRLSSNVRSERHMYDFECTIEEVHAFTERLDLALVSLSCETTTA